MIIKKNILIVLCSIMAFSLFAQVQKGFHYKIKNSSHYSIYYTPDSGKHVSKKIICRQTSLWKTTKLKANVIQGDKTPAILSVDFWAITSESSSCQIAGTINSTDTIDIKHYYFLKIEDRGTMSKPASFISLQYATTEFGVTTIPFKYRFGNKKDSIPNDASTAVAGGFYFGRKWGRTRFYQDKLKTVNTLSFTSAIFLSPVVIALSPDVSKREVTTKSNEFGLGFGAAFLLSYTDINIGFLVGIDAPISGESKKWIYANKPWIGFGIGYKLAVLNAGK